MRPTLLTALTAALFALASPDGCRAQGTQPAATPSDAKKAAKPSWPKLAGADSNRLKSLLKRLASDKPATASKAEAGIAKIGAAAAPRLIRSFAPRQAAAHAAVGRLLDRIVAAEHAPLVAPVLEHKHVGARRWAATWLARHPETDQRPALTKALAKEKDEEALFFTSLGLGARMHFDGLEPAFAACKADWPSRAQAVAMILPPARSPEAVVWMATKLREGDELDKVTALRLLRSVCPRTHVTTLKSHLDASSHAIKKAAINALRVVVDGDAPLEKLSVFKAIDEAKKWKARQ